MDLLDDDVELWQEMRLQLSRHFGKKVILKKRPSTWGLIKSRVSSWLAVLCLLSYLFAAILLTPIGMYDASRAPKPPFP